MAIDQAHAEQSPTTLKLNSTSARDGSCFGKLQKASIGLAPLPLMNILPSRGGLSGCEVVA